ncbi:MAG: nickel pincer cofactor biosynthesis protein LarB [candidate division Zixibacteria bacterium]
MYSKRIKSVLQKIADGKLSVDDGLRELRTYSFEDIGFAKIDHHRSSRTGMPEVIFAPGKTDQQIIKIFEKMSEAGSDILVSRADRAVYNKLKRKHKSVIYHESARMIVKTGRRKKPISSETIAIVTGGTSDIPVAEEAAVTIETFGGKVERIFDVGVAGIHRLLSFHENLQKAKVVIVAAGMEGALPSVVGGLVTAPVIAVPTSIGYGASFGGLAALLAMLNSCAPGVTVVNIDNGFGAAMAALKIVKRK